MAVILAFTLVGLAITAFGFAVMRDPMLLARLDKGAKGYFQRLVLDGPTRIQMRVVGAVVCVFGLMLLSVALRGLIRRPAMDSIADGFLILLWLLFAGMWVYGIIDLLRGRALNAFDLWRRAAELGPIEVVPTITPAMARESRMFVIGFSILVATTITAAFFSALH